MPQRINCGDLLGNRLPSLKISVGYKMVLTPSPLILLPTCKISRKFRQSLHESCLKFIVLLLKCEQAFIAEIDHACKR
jgi:hypothetical protein